MTFGTYVHGAQRIDPGDFGDLLIFAPPLHQKLIQAFVLFSGCFENFCYSISKFFFFFKKPNAYI